MADPATVSRDDAAYQAWRKSEDAKRAQEQPADEHLAAVKAAGPLDRFADRAPPGDAHPALGWYVRGVHGGLQAIVALVKQKQRLPTEWRDQLRDMGEQLLAALKDVKDE